MKMSIDVCNYMTQICNSFLSVTLLHILYLTENANKKINEFLTIHFFIEKICTIYFNA